jgi:hypothetical protein
LLVLVLFVLVIPLGVGACGGGDDDGGSDDTAQITEAIKTSITSTDPADCTRLQTQRFLEQSEYEVGQEAVQSCEEDAADTSDRPDSVDVSDVQVDGESATAAVAFQGGPIGTATVDVALVKEGDQWKLDQITGIRDIDLDSFKQSFTEEIEESPDIPAPIANCIKTAIGGVTEDQVKDAIVEGSQEAILGLFGNCVPNA